MKNKILILSLLITQNVIAAPWLMSDPTTQNVSYCGIKVDSNARIDFPVDVNKACKWDMVGISSGVHTITATYVQIDPVWGRVESVPSIPFTFTKPGVLGIPSGLVIMP